MIDAGSPEPRAGGPPARAILRAGMLPEMREIVKAKRAFRRRQAALPIAEKLRLLDALRERALAIAAARRCGPTPERKAK